MAIDTTLTQFAEFMGSEVKRVEGLIPTGGGSSQPTNSNIISGNGRPDSPDTTRVLVNNNWVNLIKGNEPNGTIYNSLNGAGVGAWLWQKQNNQWQPISADTGVRRITRNVHNIKSGNVSLRRINNLVECTFGGGQWGAIYFYGTNNKDFRKKSHPKRMDIVGNSGIPTGFRPVNNTMLPFYGDDGEHLGMVYIGGISNYNYIELRFQDKPPAEDMDIVRMPVIYWITNEPFPSNINL